jgi:hypothetical protein
MQKLLIISLHTYYSVGGVIQHTDKLSFSIRKLSVSFLSFLKNYFIFMSVFRPLISDSESKTGMEKEHLFWDSYN